MTTQTGDHESFDGGLDNSTEKMRWIPGGTFRMGSDAFYPE